MHIHRTSNKADALSRCPDFDNGTQDNTNVTVLPPHLFARAAMLSPIDDRAKACQLQQQYLLTKWVNTFPLKKIGDLFWYSD